MITDHWDVTPRFLVVCEQRFGRKCYISLQSRKVMIFQITLRHIPEQRSIRNVGHENIKPGTSDASSETYSYHFRMILAEK
jgi:hypothetical protein